MTKKLKTTLFLFLPLGLLVVSLLYGVFKPNQTVTFHRQVPFVQELNQITQTFNDVNSWPAWHHQVKNVQREFSGPLREGEKITFVIASKTLPWKTFDLVTEVIEFVPNERLRFRLLKDKKITKLFENVDWEIILDSTQQIVIGNLKAQTKHWKSRFYSLFAKKILLNQIFYPDLFKLAGHRSQEGIALTPRD